MSCAGLIGQGASPPAESGRPHLATSRRDGGGRRQGRRGPRVPDRAGGAWCGLVLVVVAGQQDAGSEEEGRCEQRRGDPEEGLVGGGERADRGSRGAGRGSGGGRGGRGGGVAVVALVRGVVMSSLLPAAAGGSGCSGEDARPERGCDPSCRPAEPRSPPARSAAVVPGAPRTSATSRPGLAAAARGADRPTGGVTTRVPARDHRHADRRLRCGRCSGPLPAARSPPWWCRSAPVSPGVSPS